MMFRICRFGSECIIIGSIFFMGGSRGNFRNVERSQMIFVEPFGRWPPCCYLMQFNVGAHDYQHCSLYSHRSMVFPRPIFQCPCNLQLCFEVRSPCFYLIK